MLVDAHCHLNRLDPSSFGGDVDAAWRHAKSAGLVGCLMPSVVREEWEEVVQLAERHADLYAAIAIHPSEINQPPVTLDELISHGSQAAVVGIGETGLDFAGECAQEEKQRQRELFELHIQAALQLKKPLIVHVRDAWRELLEILYRYPVDKIGGMVHCFTGNYEAAKAILDLGWHLSFSGILTFKRSDELREVLRRIPLNRVLLETDAPYLAPTPMRGKPNIPSYLRYTASQAAEVAGKSLHDLTETTSSNFFNLMLK